MEDPLSENSLNIVNVQNSNLKAMAADINGSPFGKLNNQSFSTHARNNWAEQNSGLGFCTTPPANNHGTSQQPLQSSLLDQNRVPQMDTYSVRSAQ